MTRLRADAPSLAVVIVHYHAPAALEGAVAALRRDLETSCISAEWCVVDNGSAPPERAALEALGLPLLAGSGNLGFAAGVNRGVAATSAPAILVLNPDVEVLPGCARALLAEIERGAAAAAPRLYWDRERRFLLPVGEERTRDFELLSLLSQRFAACAALARRRWRRDARRHWQAPGSLASTRLSGAALAIARTAWTQVGPFDESFRLYFEETDWLLRLETAGLSSRQAASAEAVHGFAHSTRREPRAAHWFDDSARLFRERRYGHAFARVHARLARGIDPARHPALPPAWDPDALPRAILDPAAAADTAIWLELSPNRTGFPAAGERVARADLPGWRPPSDLMRASGLHAMSLCAVTESGRELGRWWVELDSAALAAPPAAPGAAAPA
jgi:GT2 family glycosyltransferase